MVQQYCEQLGALTEQLAAASVRFVQCLQALSPSPSPSPNP